MAEADAIKEALRLVEQAGALLAQARARLRAFGGADAGQPFMDAKTAARVERLGEVAHRHLAHIEAHRSMTRLDSLMIRREMYGAEVQSTANLFGLRDSNALFWRDRPHGTPVSNDDPICLTVEGERIAKLWRATRRYSAEVAR